MLNYYKLEVKNLALIITKNFNLKRLLLILTFFVIISNIALYIKSDNWNTIKSDGLGYQAYLPQLFIYGSFEGDEIVKYFNPESEVLPDLWHGFKRNEETGRYENKFPLGVALLSSPFFFVGDLLTQVLNYERDGYSAIYDIFSNLSALFYLLIGNIFLYKVLKKRVGENATFVTLILLNFGTNLFHYSTYDASFSHVYTFALISIFLYYTEKFFDQGTLKDTIILAVTFGLLLLVRQTNILVLIIPFLYLFNKSNRISKQEFKRLALKIAIAVVMSFLIFLPQMIYWKYTGGSFLLFSYPGEYFDFLKPELLNTLFSVRKGFFFWAPILLFIVPGFIIMFKRKDYLRFGSLFFFILQAYLISSWWAWFYGFSYGHRAFVDIFPVLAIPLGYFIQYAFRTNRIYLRRFIIILFSFLLFLSLFQTQQYWRGIILGDGTTPERYVSIFLRPCIDSGIEILRCD